MAWIESHQNLGTHKKLLRLSVLLKCDRFKAVGILHYLWWWALDNAPEGDLTGITAAELAQAIGFRGTGAELINALIGAGWIDCADGYESGELSGAILHDWNDYAGKLIDQRNRNREKVKRFRNRNVTVTVTGTTPECNRSPYPTVPNPTVPVKEKIKEKSDGLVLPDFINQEAWAAFLEMRVKIKAPATVRAQQLIISTLAGLRESGHDPNKCLEQSTVNNWKDVYAVKGHRSDNGSKAAIMEVTVE